MIGTVTNTNINVSSTSTWNQYFIDFWLQPWLQLSQIPTSMFHQQQHKINISSTLGCCSSCKCQKCKHQCYINNLSINRTSSFDQHFLYIEPVLMFYLCCVDKELMVCWGIKCSVTYCLFSFAKSYMFCWCKNWVDTLLMTCWWDVYEMLIFGKKCLFFIYFLLRSP